MPNKGLKMLSVLADRVLCQTLEGKSITIKYETIATLDYSLYPDHGIIRMVSKGDMMTKLDGSSLPDNGLYDAFETWLHANGLSGFGGNRNA